MAPRFGTVRKCSGEALANFSWREYAPFAWLLAAELLFLILASNLGSTWGMATAGRIAHLVGGDGATRNPGFFVHLPAIFAYVETGIYTLAGGLREGIPLLWGTFLYLLLFSIPALVMQAIVQLFPTLIVIRLRPELILVLLFVYAILTSLATYLSYSAAVRLYMTETETEEGS